MIGVGISPYLSRPRGGAFTIADVNPYFYPGAPYLNDSLVVASNGEGVELVTNNGNQGKPDPTQTDPTKQPPYSDNLVNGQAGYTTDGLADFFNTNDTYNDVFRGDFTFVAGFRLTDGQGQFNNIIGAQNGGNADAVYLLVRDTGKVELAYNANSQGLERARTASAVFDNGLTPYMVIAGEWDFANNVMRIFHFNTTSREFDELTLDATAGLDGTLAQDPSVYSGINPYLCASNSSGSASNLAAGDFPEKTIALLGSVLSTENLNNVGEDFATKLGI